MIAIKDIEMPIGCMDCNFMLDTTGGCFCMATNNCREIEECVDCHEISRTKWCPLLEIVICKDCIYGHNYQTTREMTEC